MRLFLLVTTALAAPAFLAGCAHDVAPAASEPLIVEVTPVPAPVLKPTFGNYGFDAAGMDAAVAPGDDFYGFANGNWAKSTPIPADKSNYGAFNLLSDLSQQRTQEILKQAQADPNSKIGITYATYLDTAAIEAKGLGPIQPWLGQIKSVKAKADLPALYAQAARNGIRTPLTSGVGQDDKEPEVYALFLGQGGLGMPDRDYYLSKDAKLAETKAAYLKHLTNLLTLAGEPNAAPRAAAILAFETRLAAVHWTRVDSRDSNKTYNKMTVAALNRRAPGYDFARAFAAAG
ncbi:MAG: M13 family peptidase, partial [Sphingomonadales bacterium]